MPNLATIVVLLQTVVSLLQNPNLDAVSKATLVKLAPEVIALASQALAQPASTQLGSVASTTISQPSSTPITVIVQPTSSAFIGEGGPGLVVTTPPIVQNVLPAPVQPSCTLTGTLHNDTSSIYPRFEVSFDWTLQGDVPTAGSLLTLNGHSGNSLTYAKSGTLDETSRNNPMFGVAPWYKATFGNVSCFAFFPEIDGGAPQYEGETSTATPLPRLSKLDL